MAVPLPTSIAAFSLSTSSSSIPCIFPQFIRTLHQAQSQLSSPKTSSEVSSSTVTQSGLPPYRHRRHYHQWRGYGRLQSTASTNSGIEEESVAIVWFKQDLRLDDHPGLCSASTNFGKVLPVYIFDPFLLRGCTNDFLQALVEAVADLKLVLKGLGSDLIVRNGNIKDELCALAEEVSASAIISEEEVEYEWQQVLSSLSLLRQQNDTVWKLETWSAPLYAVEGKQLPSAYRQFEKIRYPVNQPLQAPKSLPPLPNVSDTGYVPLVPAIEDDIRSMFENDSWHRKVKDAQKGSAESLLIFKEEEVVTEQKDGTGGVFEGFLSWREKYILASPYEELEKRRQELGIQSNENRGTKNNGCGTTFAMANLNAYLRFLEPTWRADWKKLYEEVMYAESNGPRGASFRILFGVALHLGTISRRRVYHEAFEYEKARNGGLLPVFGFSTFTAAAAVQDIKSADWYETLATISKLESAERGWDARVWRWRGFLIEYTTVGERGTPIVLVHGFGAFWEHYRDNIKNLASEGSRVWALTLLGFGRSEKPDIAYTELLWAELIRDFILEVVGEPAVLVGNSIGGYMVSVVSGLWPSIVKSLILLNSAGAIVPDYRSFSYLKPKERSAITWLGSRLSLTYLRSKISQLLKRYYGVNPSRVDDWLTGEILRASYDPGAPVVLESVFCLNKPFPINWFIDRYRGKVYILQGMKDPLNNGQEKVKLFETYCDNSVIQKLNAGHCPHDEIPEEVNELIIQWLKNVSQEDKLAISESALTA